MIISKKITVHMPILAWIIIHEGKQRTVSWTPCRLVTICSQISLDWGMVAVDWDVLFCLWKILNKTAHEPWQVGHVVLTQQTHHTTIWVAVFLLHIPQEPKLVYIVFYLVLLTFWLLEWHFISPPLRKPHAGMTGPHPHWPLHHNAVRRTKVKLLS